MSQSVHRERELFEQALDLPADARASFLREVCGADITLFARVSELLETELAAGRFLGGSVSTDSIPPAVSRAPERIGRYQLLERLGEGGFGEVYLAEQTEPVRRRVALKILKPGMESRQVVARFEAERQVLALMDHPHIARVFDAGATEEGRPFFVMELVPGVPLTRYCDEQRLSLRERLTLFIEVCDALQHAHQKGVIHRDLKPSNVLVARQDGRAVPKVIDFGVAKATQPDGASPGLTRAFELLGTPAYMSPEQTQLSGLEIDTRSDIYALGVLLYELLTGRTPFDQKELLAAGLDEMRRTIREKEPRKPSTRLTQELEKVSKWVSEKVGDTRSPAAESHSPTHPPTHSRPRPRPDPQELQRRIPLLRGDLDWIVLRCLEKDRERRYASAAALADDLRRHLSDEPVEAAAPGVSYRLNKFLRRHRLAVTAAAAVLLVMAAATAVSLTLAWRARIAERTAHRLLEIEQQQGQLLEKLRRRADEEAARARIEAATAQAASRFLNEDVFSWADPAREPEREITLRAVLDRASRQLSSSLTNEPAVAAAIHETLGRAYLNLALWDAAARHYEAARSLFTRTRGANAEASLRTAIEAAHAQHRAGDSANALPLAEAATALARDRLTRSHPLALHCGNRLAWFYYNLNRIADWHREAEETYQDMQGVEGIEDADLLGVMYLVARKRGTLRGGVFEAGEQILLHAAALMQERRGPTHPLTVQTKTFLAVYYYDHWRHVDQAEALFLEVFEWQRRTLGETHQNTLTTLQNLGLLYRRGQRTAAAQRSYLQLLALRPGDATALAQLPNLMAKAPLPPLSPTSESLTWRTTAAKPAGRWAALDFDDSEWTVTTGAPTVDGEGWWRASFELVLPPAEPLVVSLGGVAHGEIHFNGVPAGPEFRSTSRKGHVLVTSPDAIRALRAGRNVIALRVLEADSTEPFRLALHPFPPPESRP